MKIRIPEVSWPRATNKPLVYLAVAFLALLVAACGSGASPGGQSGSTSTDEESTLGLSIECNDGGFYDLNQYAREAYGTFAPPSRICSVRWAKGTPEFDAKTTIGPLSRSREVGKLKDGRFVFWTYIPLLPPGQHELFVDVTDLSGKTERASTSISFSWTSDEVSVEIRDPQGSAVTIDPGTELHVTAKAFAYGFSTEQVGTELERESEVAGFIYDLLDGSITAKWDFGDGTQRSVPITPVTNVVFQGEYGDHVREREIDAELTQTHVYNEPGEYEVRLTVTDEEYQRTGSASLSVQVRAPKVAATEEPIPEPEATTEQGLKWVLVETLINPEGAQLNEPVVFPDTTPKPEGSAICINVGRTYYFKSANVSAGSMSVQRQAWKWKPCTGETERREQVTFSFTFDLPPSEFPDGELFELHMAAEVSGEDRLDVGTKFGYRQTLGTSFSGSVEVSMDKPADSGVFRFSPSSSVYDSARAGKGGGYLQAFGPCEACVVRFVYELRPN